MKGQFLDLLLIALPFIIIVGGGLAYSYLNYHSPQGEIYREAESEYCNSIDKTYQPEEWWQAKGSCCNITNLHHGVIYEICTDIPDIKLK